MSKKEIINDLKVRFNDIVMRELGLDITEKGYIYEIDSNTILTIKGKPIKYIEYDIEEVVYVKHNEIEFNLLANPRLMETLCLPFISGYCDRHGYIFHSMSQCPITGSNSGIFVISYIDRGIMKEITSEPYVNESIRIASAITKLNNTSNMYQFNKFDTVDITELR